MRVLSLKGKALTWASQVLMGRIQTIDLAELKAALKQRFGSHTNDDITLSRFLNMGTSQTRDKFSEMLRLATAICEKRLISMGALAQMVINKSALEIKGTLYEGLKSVGTWEEFVQKAEELSWIAYPDKTLMALREENEDAIPESQLNCNQHTAKFKGRKKNLRNDYGKDNGSRQEGGRANTTQKTCALHGTGNHWTRECRRIDELFEKERRERLKTRKVYVAQENEREGTSEEDNKRFIYSFSDKTDRGNIFMVKCTTEVGTRRCLVGTRRCLVDTGADASIIRSKDMITGKHTLEPYNGAVRTASGDQLSILGRVKNYEITLNKKIITLSPLVIPHCKFIIIGADTADRQIDILLEIIKQSGYNKRIYSNVKVVSAAAIEDEYKDIFKTEIDEYSLCDVGQHAIITASDHHIWQRSTRIPIAQEVMIEEEIQKNLRLGIIRPSTSPWCSRIVIVPKPGNAIRMCIDYRSLNSITIKDRYMSPRIDEILDRLAGAEIYSVLDATSGFYQIALKEKDKQKTAFAFRGELYEYNRMPFGLCNAPATFQRIMDNVFREENQKFIIPYLDDIIVFSKSKEEHERHLKIALGKLKAAGLSLNKNKCKFYRSEVKTLGHIVSKKHIKVDPEKTEAIKGYPMPTTIKELRSFLGMVNFCREYIPKLADLTAQLFDVLKGEKKKSNKNRIKQSPGGSIQCSESRSW